MGNFWAPIRNAYKMRDRHRHWQPFLKISVYRSLDASRKALDGNLFEFVKLGSDWVGLSFFLTEPHKLLTAAYFLFFYFLIFNLSEIYIRNLKLIKIER